MQNWNQLLELAQITEQERQSAALMAAERRRQRREARKGRSLVGRIIHRA
jgi:hypothetical protein